MLLVSGRSPVPEFLVVFICLLFWARKKDGVSSKSNGWFNNGNSVSPCTSSSSSLVFIGHLDRKQLYKTVVLSICFGKIGTCTIQIHWMEGTPQTPLCTIQNPRHALCCCLKQLNWPGRVRLAQNKYCRIQYSNQNCFYVLQVVVLNNYVKSTTHMKYDKKSYPLQMNMSPQKRDHPNTENSSSIHNFSGDIWAN